MWTDGQGVCLSAPVCFSLYLLFYYYLFNHEPSHTRADRDTPPLSIMSIRPHVLHVGRLSTVQHASNMSYTDATRQMSQLLTRADRHGKMVDVLSHKLAARRPH